MKHKATIGHAKGDFHYIMGIAGQVLDRQSNVVGKYHYVTGTDVRVESRQTRNGIWENWTKVQIKGHLNDGRTFVGHVTYLPGEMTGTHRGEITISDARAPRKPSFQRNMDIMVWHNIETGYFTVLVRQITKSGWVLFRGRPMMSSKDTPAPFVRRETLLAFNPSPDWGIRTAISNLPSSDRSFFKAYAAAR